MAWYDIATFTSALLPAELGLQSAAAALRPPSSESSSAEFSFCYLLSPSIGPDSSLPCTRLGDQFYKEAIEHCRSYNSRLCAERSVRLPFLDSQTGVAQNNCYIWMEKRHRGPGLAPGQLYTYPARCWRKKRRLHPPEDSRLKLLEIKPALTIRKRASRRSRWGFESLKWLDPKPVERVLENDENADEVNEEEELEEDIPKRKNRPRGRARGSGGGRRRNDAASQDDHDKPYVCDICGKRYKNRPGLSYHYAHTHLASEEGDEAQEQETRSPPVHRNENHKPQKGPDGAIIPNNYCDFCLGGSSMNKKSGCPEELVSCSDCGRSASFKQAISEEGQEKPECFDISPLLAQPIPAGTGAWTVESLLAPAQKFWNALSLCNTKKTFSLLNVLISLSFMRDQLLFCDDCDRGYHMYCLNPPVSEPPEETEGFSANTSVPTSTAAPSPKNLGTSIDSDANTYLTASTDSPSPSIGHSG
ncbi:Zinc finger protein DPF3 [Chelonia mydas]|uniref:Zinc finger protein DPF3 n=1 Tax=Chelonia mydas TaxID=8469 RepID=M7CFA5_CHEMY|nr:Zinc finger protein DPF3 [Chelonia mydas]